MSKKNTSRFTVSFQVEVEHAGTAESVCEDVEERRVGLWASRQQRSKNFRSDSLANIVRMNQIVEEYSAEGLRLTGRQLYYQFVSRDWIPNTERSYKNR